MKRSQLILKVGNGFRKTAFKQIIQFQITLHSKISSSAQTELKIKAGTRMWKRSTKSRKRALSTTFTTNLKNSPTHFLTNLNNLKMNNLKSNLNHLFNPHSNKMNKLYTILTNLKLTIYQNLKYKNLKMN
ncbi:Hypothetical_protein [Hexamita inflata]|uniref:Hypothetical_protein n=1 Tax=Hexamita inflata TaxID=28002 RepID=A0AA86TVB2_9EUKA|nr:Hypothetical protein HINF_LOCUS7428 [Hexamita inflata]CAI9928482.1 Hypothetical protein HINF_LOCUS16127 [Hexamita inflata]